MHPPTNPKIEQLRQMKKQAHLGGGEDRLAAHKAKGKLTARERIDVLLDKGSFHEVDALVVPVSYTHLDVYKRQDHELVARNTRVDLERAPDRRPR